MKIRFTGVLFAQKLIVKSEKSCIFAKNIKTQKNRKEMKFTERIKQLREKRQMPQRQFAAALEIDTATYCKIEKGERRVKAEQVVIIAELLKTDKDELLAFWLADQVAAVVEDEHKVADKALNMAKKEYKL